MTFQLYVMCVTAFNHVTLITAFQSLDTLLKRRRLQATAPSSRPVSAEELEAAKKREEAETAEVLRVAEKMRVKEEVAARVAAGVQAAAAAEAARVEREQRNEERARRRREAMVHPRTMLADPHNYHSIHAGVLFH